MCAACLLLSSLAHAQPPPVAKPQPPPPVAEAPGARPATPATTTPATTTPATTSPASPAATAKPAVAVAPAHSQPSAPATPPASADPSEGNAPTEAQLGVRIYPGARFITSYDAGRGQRYYLFGALQTFAEMVTFYKTELKDKGELVFDAPPTHMFEVGKFREESMAFPPSVTIKDYTWGGSPGYANAAPGATPPAFPTVIQIVPPPAAPAGPIR